jgi:AcrR family transcriptional regulator
MRRGVLAAARDLLLAQGPAGVTLTAVAERVDRSHSNVIHHFGSAEALHSALMSSMVEDLSAALVEALSALAPGEARGRMLVDIVFDAFDRGGAGILAAWIVLSNKQRYLEPIRAAVTQLAAGVNARLARDFPNRPRHVPSALLFLTLCAFADALVGRELNGMLKMDRTAMRGIAEMLIPEFLEAQN